MSEETKETPKTETGPKELLSLSGTPPLAYLNEPYSWAPTLSGATLDNCKLTLTEGLPPAGMIFKDGRITGTPNTEGKTTFTITAFDGVSSISMRYEIPVEKRPVIDPTSLLVGSDKTFSVYAVDLEFVCSQKEVKLYDAREIAYKLFALLVDSPTTYKCATILKLVDAFASTVFAPRNLWVNASADTIRRYSALGSFLMSKNKNRDEFDRLAMTYSPQLRSLMIQAVTDRASAPKK